MPTNREKRWILGFGPLHYAVFFGDAEILRCIAELHSGMLEEVIASEFCFADYKFYPIADLLSICCTSQSIQVVSDVIEYYARGNILPKRDLIGQTCLHAAAALETNGARTISSNKMLVYNLITARRKDGKTPLHIGAVYRNTPFIEQLVCFGRNPQIRQRLSQAASSPDDNNKKPQEYAQLATTDRFYAEFTKLMKIVRYEQNGSVTNWNSEDMSMFAKTDSSYLVSCQFSDYDDTSDYMFAAVL